MDVRNTAAFPDRCVSWWTGKCEKKEKEKLSGEKHGYETLENHCALATGLLKGLPTGISPSCFLIRFNDLQTSLPLLWSLDGSLGY